MGGVRPLPGVITMRRGEEFISYRTPSLLAQSIDRIHPLLSGFSTSLEQPSTHGAQVFPACGTATPPKSGRCPMLDAGHC